ncbi:hypothetical protein B9Z55_013610 [Caenorhabditis nigoni]|uniref:Uncharacterized protein n=1 Tax=Caenorhabditis nigoni TaxID=1611254 RepID=A0A2G5U2H6_9PELO|nr:hypothetical protein B9Z55_013610 [Caenorhabditis nigoni]
MKKNQPVSMAECTSSICIYSEVCIEKKEEDVGRQGQDRANNFFSFFSSPICILGRQQVLPIVVGVLSMTDILSKVPLFCFFFERLVVS